MIRAKYDTDEIVVDLTGPQGNAFALLGLAKAWAKDLGLDGEQIVKEMKSGDYDNLVAVIDKYFGDVVVFER